MNDIAELFIEPMRYDFMQRALIVSLLVGIMCPVIGAYVVARGRAFMGDALAHSVLPGMGVGLLATGSALIAAVPTGVRNSPCSWASSAAARAAAKTHP